MKACTGNRHHEGHLDSPRKELPPYEDLAILNTLAWVVNPVLRKKFDEGYASSHIEEQPGKREELDHPSPDTKGLGGR
jgi:hypothetical protein